MGEVAVSHRLCHRVGSSNPMATAETQQRDTTRVRYSCPEALDRSGAEDCDGFWNKAPLGSAKRLSPRGSSNTYLERLPGAMVEADDGSRDCRYSPHTLRATTATLLDEAGVPIKRIQELLGHKDMRVTRAYIKLLRDTKKSASHDMPL